MIILGPGSPSRHAPGPYLHMPCSFTAVEDQAHGQQTGLARHVDHASRSAYYILPKSYPCVFTLRCATAGFISAAMFRLTTNQ